MFIPERYPNISKRYPLNIHESYPYFSGSPEILGYLGICLDISGYLFGENSQMAGSGGGEIERVRGEVAAKGAGKMMNVYLANKNESYAQLPAAGTSYCSQYHPR